MAGDGNGITVSLKLLTLLGGTAIAIIGWTISIEVQRRQDAQEISDLQQRVKDIFNEGTKANQILRQRVDTLDKITDTQRSLLVSCYNELQIVNQKITADEVDTKRAIERIDKLGEALDSTYNLLNEHLRATGGAK